jgi:glycosyltransferase involved in cell wall biosynthesis
MKETSYIWAYLTSINLQSNSAETLQTCSMIGAFKEKLNMNFQLFTDRKYSTDISGVEASSVGLIFKNRIGRQIFVFLSFVLFKNRKVKYSVFTREFILAYLSHFIGSEVILELHKVPSKKIFSLLSLVANSKRFRILAISEGLKKNILSINPELSVISEHDGVDLKKWTKHEKLAHAEKNPIKVTYTGSLHKGDDIFLLARAAKHFPDLTFYIYGGSDDEINVLLSHVDFKSLKNLEFKGRVQHDEIPMIQRNSDILFFPLTETNPLWNSTSPLKLFEYMATGTPIVSSNVGTITEVLNDSNSYLFAPTSDESLILAISEALSDLNSNNVSRPSMARIDVEEFSWNKRVERIVRK